MKDAPVFHRQVHEAIRSRLASSRPGIAVIAGPAGSGRTHLLRHVAVSAKELGYRVLRGTDTEPTAIEPSTTVTDILRRLHSLAVSEPQDGTRSSATPLTTEVTPQEHCQIAELLEQMAPVLVAVDGYRPSSTLESWLTCQLIPHLRSSGGRVAIVVADRAEPLRRLSELADQVFALGPLEPEEVRAHLTNASAKLSPPLTSEELARYVDSATQPAVLSALLAVFGAYSRTRVEVAT